MSKINDLKEQLAAIQKEIDSLGALQGLPWSYKPGYKDRYCLVDGGVVHIWGWVDDSGDNSMYDLGNCFETIEQAEKELETRKVIAELRRCEGVKKFEFGTGNFGVCVEIEDDIYTVETECRVSGLGLFAEVYFKSQDDAWNAINKVGVDKIIAAAKWMSRGE